MFKSFVIGHHSPVKRFEHIYYNKTFSIKESRFWEFGYYDFVTITL